jgi:hypothetical protein
MPSFRAHHARGAVERLLVLLVRVISPASVLTAPLGVRLTHSRLS